MRILQSNLQIIASAPLQIYSSVLLFAPHESIVKNLFKDRIPKWISLEPKVERSWSQCIKVLEGHQGFVNSVAFSPNSLLLASASDDKTIRLWNIDTGECIEEFKGHTKKVNAVVFSHDSLYVLSGSKDTTIRLWCIDTGKCVQTLEGHDFSVISVAFSHDSSFVASASSDNVIRLWHVDTSECVHILGMPSKSDDLRASSLAFSNDSSLLASGFSRKPITQLWDTNTGTYIRTLSSRETLEPYSDKSIAFSHNLSLVASPSNHVIQVWRADTGECVQEFKGHCRNVLSIAFSHDSSLMVSASSDKTVRLWNVETGACIRNFQGHSSIVRSVAFSHDSTIIASSSNDETIRLWHNNLDNDVQESDDYINKALPLKRAETSDGIQGNRGYSGGVKDMIFSHDSSLVASSSYDGIVRIWHAETGDCVRELRRWYISQDSPQQQSPLEICRIIFSHNSTYVAMAPSDETSLWIWNVNTGECFRKLTYRKDIYPLAFSHDSSLIASASEGTIPLWRVDTGDCFLELELDFEYENISQSLAFSHDSSLLASESGHAIQLWSVDTGECIRELMRGGIIRGGTWFPAVAFSHDSSLIASISESGIIRLWRTNTGECVHKFHTHRRDGLNYLSFTPDGLHLVTRFGALITPCGEQTIRFDGFGFNEDFSWITWNGVNLIWIPMEYRPSGDCSVVSEGTLAVGCNSGRVWFMKFLPYPH